MPPESLSTLAVINPGPRTARNSNIRIRQRFHITAHSYGGVIIISSMNITAQTQRCELQARASLRQSSTLRVAETILFWYIGTNVGEAINVSGPAESSRTRRC